MIDYKNDLIIRHPGKIGDLLITVPIAYKYINEGKRVFWPVLKQYFPSFNSAFPEILWHQFISSESEMYKNVDPLIESIIKTDSKTSSNKIDILDLGFDFSNTNLLTSEYSQQQQYTFDEFKYHLAETDISHKWRLKEYLKRNHQRENKLFNDLVRKDKYILIQEKSSDQEVKINLYFKDNSVQIIKMYPITNNIFDWLTIIEKAQSVVLIESCFSNLIDQLEIKNQEQVLILKSLQYYHYKLPDGRIKGCPILRNDWKRMSI